MKKDYDTQKDTLSHRETRTHAHTHAHTYTEKCVMHIDPHVHGCILYIEIIYIYIYIVLCIFILIEIAPSINVLQTLHKQVLNHQNRYIDIYI